MKKITRLLTLTALVLTFLLANNITANAKGIEIKTSKDGTEYQQLVWAPNDEMVFSMLQGGDLLGELPSITIKINGEEADGIFTYPNYDNMRLGTWGLEWMFTPTNINYEPITGVINIDISPLEVEEVETPTTPSLTATIVTLESRTAYDINLNDKITGSSYKWTSDNPEVAKVNAKNGLVTAVSEGEALITCEITLTDETVQALTSIVTVGYDENAPVLTETILDLEVGDKFDINLENKIAKSKYRWVSSDRKIVKVNSANGKIDAVGVGEAYVTCTITTPENQAIVLRCDISVTELATTE